MTVPLEPAFSRFGGTVRNKAHEKTSCHTFDSAAVNDEDAVLDGDGRLGDVGRHHDLADPPRGYLEDRLLVRRRQGAVQGVHPSLVLKSAT